MLSLLVPLQYFAKITQDERILLRRTNKKTYFIFPWTDSLSNYIISFE